MESKIINKVMEVKEIRNKRDYVTMYISFDQNKDYITMCISFDQNPLTYV